MKKSVFIFLITIVLGLSFSSCGKDNEDNGSITNDFIIKGTVDGKELICTTGAANLDPNLRSLLAVGRIKSGSTFTGFDLHLSSFTGKGTYTLGGDSPNIGQYYLTADGNENNSYSTSAAAGVQGKVVVESYDNNRATGTFEFTASNTKGGSKTVTKGSFSFNLTTLK